MSKHHHQSNPATPATGGGSPAIQLALAKISQDDFSRKLRHQAPLTEAQIRGVFLEQIIGPDLADALVNKPERRDELLAMYGDGWVEGYQPNTLLLMIVVRERQVAMWDMAANMPGEPLSKSILFARFNQWATNGNYIKDALNHDLNDIPTLTPNDPGYRAPGSGPWFEATRTV